MKAAIALTAAALTAAARADVVINEIHCAPDPKTAQLEFVELLNTGPAPADLGNWAITGGVDFVFPPGTTLAPGAYLLLAENPAALTAAYFPPPVAGSAAYTYTTVAGASGFPGTTLAGQDGWVEPAGGTGVKARNDIDAVPGFSGNNAYNSAAGVYATRKNNAAFTYSIPASATTLKLSLVGRVNSTAVAALGLGVDSSGNGSINSANALGEYGFEFGCLGNTWFIRQAAQGAVTQSPSLGFSSTGRSWLMELRVDLAANSEDGAGSLFVRNLGDTSNNPVNDTLQPVPSLQNINLGIKRMSANGGNSSPPAWNGLVTRIGAGNIDALTIEWSSSSGTAAPQILPFTGHLGNDGEKITLRDTTGTTQDEVDYQAEFPWPVSAGGDGPSMQLINPALDNDLGGSWRAAAPTPAAANAVFSANAPPQIRQVDHTPQLPAANAPVLVTARISDPDGMGSVTLLYQSVAPGSFVPAYFPLTFAQLTTNAATPRTPNPAFENPANWTSVAMNDGGMNGDSAAGDGIFTGAIPGQPNRTLLRYRIQAADAPGASVRVPYADDPSLNFACFVYNGVPAYTAATRSVHPDGAGHVYPVEVMTALPVHTLITRPEDLRACNAYSSLGDAGQQIPKSNDAARSAFNWEGAFVYEGVVYDHMNYRLRQANDRYAGDGKRSMRFRFNKGHYFQARDHTGKKVDEKWESINTGKMSRFGGANVSGIREVVNAQLWRLFGVEMPHYYHAHFRVIDGPDEAPTGANGQYLGDFFGLAMFYEDFEGSFLANRGLPDGNIYKWKDGFTNPAILRQFQAADAVTDGSDLNTIYNQLRPERDSTWLRQRVDWDQWYRYHGIVEAVRHYDFGVTAAHMKNRGWYFMPAAGAPHGLLRHIPHDHDATWYRGYHDGLTVGIGVDFPMQAIYGYNGTTEKPEFTRAYRNVLRELRDLLWREESVHDMIDRTTARIAAFSVADRDRWLSAPAAAGFETSMPGMETVAAEMKSFAFTVDTVNGAALAGGRGAYLDQLANDSGIPGTPTLSYTGLPGYPTNGVSLQASSYAAGSDAAAAIEWRLAEITDPSAPAYDPQAEVMYEITATWQTKLAAPFSGQISVPTLALRPGHTYRARVRYADTAGRVSHWSAPLQFTAIAPDVSAYREALVISEIMYRGAGGNPDLEFVELLNVGNAALDLTDVRFTKGIDFDFAGSAVTSLAPGGRVLVVRNSAAFISHYGSGLPIAGEYQFNDENNLGNSGEQLKLSLGAGVPIQDFVYGATAPWPQATDGAAFSIVLRDPFSQPDHAQPQNWISGSAEGSPGAADAPAFSGPAHEDADHDGLPSIVEAALGMSDAAADAMPLSLSRNADGTVTVQLISRPGATNLASSIQCSSDLSSWQPLPPETVFSGTTRRPDGSSVSQWQHPAPQTSRFFLRVQAAAAP